MGPLFYLYYKQAIMNKHKRTAILIAPFLAIGGFIIADYFQQPPDKKAASFTVNGNCDLKKQCQLNAGDLQIQLSYSGQMHAKQQIQINLQTSAPVENILLALSDKDQNYKPLKLAASNDRKQWQGQYLIHPSLDIENLILQLVVNYNGVSHFAEIKPNG